MLDVHLNGALEVVVVFIAAFKLEVDKETEVAVETEKIFLVTFVSFKLALKGNGVAAVADVSRTAVNAVAILAGHERLDVDPVLGILDRLREVLTAAILALVLVLFDVDEDVIREAHMDEGVQAALEGL